MPLGNLKSAFRKKNRITNSFNNSNDNTATSRRCQQELNVLIYLLDVIEDFLVSVEFNRSILPRARNSSRAD